VGEVKGRGSSTDFSVFFLCGGYLFGSHHFTSLCQENQNRRGTVLITSAVLSSVGHEPEIQAPKEIAEVTATVNGGHNDIDSRYMYRVKHHLHASAAIKLALASYSASWCCLSTIGAV
jgi:trehalose-6-phosphate synthase